MRAVQHLDTDCIGEPRVDRSALCIARDDVERDAAGESRDDVDVFRMGPRLAGGQKDIVERQGGL